MSSASRSRSPPRCSATAAASSSAHVKALPGNRYDGHTLATVIPAIETAIGANLGKIVADAGYRGHNAPKDKMFKVHVAGYQGRHHQGHQAGTATPGRCRTGHRPSQAGPPHGPQLPGLHRSDANNAMLAGVGYNFSLLLNWLRLLFAYLLALLQPLRRHRSSHDQPDLRSSTGIASETGLAYNAGAEWLSSRATEELRKEDTTRRYRRPMPKTLASSPFSKPYLDATVADGGSQT